MFRIRFGILGAMLLTGGGAWAGAVKLAVRSSRQVLHADRSQRVYLKVDLEGGEISRDRQRAPVNVALVLDRSGSMSGKKLQQAKKAAIMSIARLDSRDIISVLAYDDTVRVLVPATKVADRQRINRAIHRLRAGGMTALYGGVSKGAAEVRKFIAQERINRVILLSDGLANVGPSTPSALAALGGVLAKEGISVTTVGLGLGYNEDLMVRLASASDGNHAFVEHPEQLARIFDREFGDVLSVVAKDVYVTINCPAGVRPVRVLGRPAQIIGRRVKVRLNQLYGAQKKYALVELAVPSRRADTALQLARVNVRYVDLAKRRSQLLNGDTTVSFSASGSAVENSTDSRVMVAVVEQRATENTARAVALRDRGQKKQAKQVLMRNASYLRSNAARFRSKKLDKLSQASDEDAVQLNKKAWRRRRKAIRKRQYDSQSQQVW